MRASLRSAGHRAVVFIIVCVFASACWLARANAAEPERADDEGTTKVTLGLAAIVGPDFEGSEDYGVQPFPQVRVEDFYGFSLNGPSLSYDLLRDRQEDGDWELRAGPSLSLGFGRDEDDNDALEGLGDIDASVLAGGFVRVRYGPVMLNLSGGQDVADGHGGALIAARLSTMVPLGERLRVIPGLSATWASGEFMQSTFGVTAAQAARSIYAPYEAEAGIKDVGVSLNLRYKITDSWSANALVSYKRLLGEAADSPIVEGPGGSPDQVVGLIGISYAFSF